MRNFVSLLLFTGLLTSCGVFGQLNEKSEYLPTHYEKLLGEWLLVQPDGNKSDTYRRLFFLSNGTFYSQTITGDKVQLYNSGYFWMPTSDKLMTLHSINSIQTFNTANVYKISLTKDSFVLEGYYMPNSNGQSVQPAKIKELWIKVE